MLQDFIGFFKLRLGQVTSVCFKDTMVHCGKTLMRNVEHESQNLGTKIIP